MPHKQNLNTLIDDRTDRREKALTLAQVVKVRGKETSELEEGNIEVDVETRREVGKGDETRRHHIKRIPVVTTEHSGHAPVPHVGDWVWLDFTMARRHQPMVVGASYTDRDRAPHALEGHWRHQFRHKADRGEPSADRLYLEAVPEKENKPGNPVLLRMGVKDGGLNDPSTEVSVDDRQTSRPMNVRCIRAATDGALRLFTHSDGVTGGEQNLSMGDDELDISIATDKGTINISNVEDDIVVENDTGDITVKNTDGDVDVTSNNGSVSVDAGEDVSVDSSGNVNIDSGGDVYINGTEITQLIENIANN